MHKSSFYCVCYFSYWVSFFILFQKNIVFLFSHSTSSPQMSSIKKIDISFLKEPGIYEILDVQNDCSYYGETSCLLYRFQIHLLGAEPQR